jgi:hypothetical protein
MAAANILTVGDTAANSGDITVAAGTPLTVQLKYTGAQTSDAAEVKILLKDDAAAYWPTGAKLTAYEPIITLYGPGTYRFARKAGASCGVFSG